MEQSVVGRGDVGEGEEREGGADFVEPGDRLNVERGDEVGVGHAVTFFHLEVGRGDREADALDIRAGEDRSVVKLSEVAEHL